MGMRVDIVTLFPEMCQQVLDASILGRAAKRGYIETHCHQIRDYTLNKQKQTDDYPYGGGCGMVLYAQPIADCLRAVQQEVAAQGRPAPHIVFLTAGGQRYTEEHARRLAQYDNLTLVCGHYEGIDERVIDAFADEEISIGDYILTGGELASLVVADSVLRLKPGVLAEQKGYEEESYWDGLLEYPQYTRPEVWEGRAVPQVLLGGDHQKIDTWRGQQSRERTRLRRPELYEQWCETHPITQLPKWKRGENMRLVKTEEQFAAAARLFAEGRRTVCEGCWTEEALAEWTPEFFYAQLKEEKTAGLGGLPALHQGCAGRHGGREPQDRAGRAPVHHGRRPGQRAGAETAGFCPQKAAGARAPGADGTGQKHPGHCPLPPHGLEGVRRGRGVRPCKGRLCHRSRRAAGNALRGPGRSLNPTAKQAGNRSCRRGPQGVTNAQNRARMRAAVEKNVENFCVTPITFRE